MNIYYYYYQPDKNIRILQIFSSVEVINRTSNISTLSILDQKSSTLFFKFIYYLDQNIYPDPNLNIIIVQIKKEIAPMAIFE